MVYSISDLLRSALSQGAGGPLPPSSISPPPPSPGPSLVTELLVWDPIFYHKCTWHRQPLEWSGAGGDGASRFLRRVWMHSSSQATYYLPKPMRYCNCCYRYFKRVMVMCDNDLHNKLQPRVFACGGYKMMKY
jgi:hypothetical protein